MAERLELRALPVGQGTCNLVLRWDDDKLNFLGIFDCGNDRTDAAEMKKECIEVLRGYMYKRAASLAKIDAYVDFLVISHADNDHISFIWDLFGDFASTDKQDVKILTETDENIFWLYRLLENEFINKAVVEMNGTTVVEMNNGTKGVLNFIENRNWIKAQKLFKQSITREFFIEYDINKYLLTFQLLTKHSLFKLEQVKAFSLRLTDNDDVEIYFAYPEHFIDIHACRFSFRQKFFAENNGNEIKIVKCDEITPKALNIAENITTHLQNEPFEVALGHLRTALNVYSISLSEQTKDGMPEMLVAINSFLCTLLSSPLVKYNKGFDGIKEYFNEHQATASVPQLRIGKVLWGGQFNFEKQKQYTKSLSLTISAGQAIDRIKLFAPSLIAANQTCCECSAYGSLKFHFCNYDAEYFGHVDAGKGEKFKRLKSPENACSVITQVIYGTKLLAVFPGDATTQSMSWVETHKEEVMNGLVNPNAVFLTAPHHGSLETTLDITRESKTLGGKKYEAMTLNSFLDIFQPCQIVISAGYKNQHGHPQKRVVDAYIEWLKTRERAELPQHGLVYNLTDGKLAKYEMDATPFAIYTLLASDVDSGEIIFKEYITDLNGCCQLADFYPQNPLPPEHIHIVKPKEPVVVPRDDERQKLPQFQSRTGGQYKL